VKFLVDANLPPALAQWLVSEGHEALHVADLGMQAMADREIWQHARDSRACIVTKDEDFVLLQALDRAGPRRCLDSYRQRGSQCSNASLARVMARGDERDRTWREGRRGWVS
jgi:predicted nuclease of predicted toxin-antitoxin system